MKTFHCEEVTDGVESFGVLVIQRRSQSAGISKINKPRHETPRRNVMESNTHTTHRGRPPEGLGTASPGKIIIKKYHSSRKQSVFFIFCNTEKLWVFTVMNVNWWMMLLLAQKSPYFCRVDFRETQKRSLSKVNRKCARLYESCHKQQIYQRKKIFLLQTEKMWINKQSGRQHLILPLPKQKSRW